MTPETTVARAPDSVTEDLGAESVVWLSGDKTLHLLDASGALVWHAIDRASTVGDVTERIAADAQADPDVVRRDVSAFLADLAARSLVVTD